MSTISVKRPEETKEVLTLLKQKPEIDNKIDFYKGVLKATGNIIQSITDKINRGGYKEKFSVLGLPITRTVKLDSYDVAKLEIEQLELVAELETKKQYFESWLERKKQYEVKFALITEECNTNYDDVVTEADSLKDEISSLATYMDKYVNKNNDQQLKNEYYLFLKYEVEKFKFKRKHNLK